jgi:homopolymeric O-antigen transport system ATP-binding protein
MSCDEVVIEAKNISKCYQIFSIPHHRLLQILFRGKRKFYKEFWALQEISFSIKRGECVGILGRNGAGKSTLLQIIAGTLAQSGGEVVTNGRISALLELGSGFNPEFTGRDNIYLNGSILGMSKVQIDEKFDDIAEFADIGEHLEQSVKTYSSGMRMRLAFAVQAQLEPDIFVVDEALSVGDAAFQMKCVHRLNQLIEQGTTVLFVSHSIQSIRTFCNRCIWIDNGKIRMEDDTKVVTSHYNEMLFGLAGAAGLKKDQKSENLKNPTQLATPDGFDVVPLDTHPRADKLRRWGSGEIKINSFIMHGEKDGVKKNFQYGEKITVNIEAELLTNFLDSEIAVALAVRNTKGIDVLSIGSDRLGEYSTITNAGECIRASISFTNYIAPGDYDLILAIVYFEDGKRKYADYVENAHSFTVLSDRRHFGIFEPPAEITFYN